MKRYNAKQQIDPDGLWISIYDVKENYTPNQCLWALLPGPSNPAALNIPLIGELQRMAADAVKWREQMTRKVSIEPFADEALEEIIKATPWKGVEPPTLSDLAAPADNMGRAMQTLAAQNIKELEAVVARAVRIPSAFETFMRKRFGATDRELSKVGDEYISSYMHALWETWQAAVTSCEHQRCGTITGKGDCGRRVP